LSGWRRSSTKDRRAVSLRHYSSACRKPAASWESPQAMLVLATKRLWRTQAAYFSLQRRQYSLLSVNISLRHSRHKKMSSPLFSPSNTVPSIPQHSAIVSHSEQGLGAVGGPG